MFCKKCGSEIQSGMKFCMNCGTSVEIESQTNPVENNAPVMNNPIPQEVNQPIQQPVQPQMVPQQPMQPNGKKKKDIIFFVVIAIIGVALISIPIVLNLMKDKDKPSSNTNSSSGLNTSSNSGYNTNTNYTNSNSQYQFTNNNTNSNSGYNTNTNSNSGFNSNTNTNNNGNTQDVTLQGYTFKVPSSAKVELDNDEASITGLRTQDDMAFMGVMYGSFDQYKDNKDLVRQQLQSTGFTIGDISINTYGGVEFIVVPVSSGGQSVIYGIAKLSDTKIVMVMVANTKTYQLDYTLLNEMGAIVASAKSSNEL